MTKHVFFFLLFLSSINLFSQIKFQRTYDVGFMDMFTNVQQTTDGGFIITGTDMGFPPIYSSVIKLDTAGTVQWAKEYGDGELFSFFGTYFLNDVKVTTDGGYILTGECTSSGYDDLFLIKTDANGNIQWSKGYGGGNSDCGNYVMQTSDGGYLSVGTTYSFGVKDSANIYIVKTDASGNMQWDRAVQIVPDDDDVALAVEEAADGFIVVGRTEQVFAGVDTTSDIVILKTDINGNVQWLNTYGNDTEDETANAIELINSGSIIVSGYTTESVSGLDASDGYIMDIDGSGNITWSSAYDIGFSDEPQSIKKTSDGGYTIIGFTIAQFFPLEFKSFLMKANSSGNIDFAMHYGTGTNFAIFSDGQQTSDNGYIIGTIGILGYDYYMIKTDEFGNSGCNESPFTALKRTFSPPPIATAHTDFSGGSSQDISVDVNATSPVETTLCIEVPCDTPIVTITPAAPSICEGESVSLTASGADTYSWDTGDNSATITVSPSTTTTYTVVGTTGGICPSNPTSVTVNVTAAPVISISGTTTICEGESTTLTASGGDAYSWSSGDNSASTTVSPASNTTYTVTVTNSSTGCTNTASQLITVNTVPVASISGTASLCEGDTATLTASGADTYLWSNGDSVASISVSPSASTTYIVTVTNSVTGCFDTTSQQIILNPVPNIILSGDTSLCIGDSTTITASGGDLYLWSNNDTLNYISITPLNDVEYYVTVTDSSTSCYSIDTVNVYVHSLPIASATGTDTTCQGISSQLTASGGTSYSWSPVTGLDNPLIDNPLATPDSTTTYIVTVFNDFGCFDTASITITINPAPQFSISATNISCNGGTDGTVSVNILSGISPVDFVWSNGDTSSIISDLSSGYYSITVTDAINCSAYDSVFVSEPLAFSDSINIADVSCHGLNDGQIELFISGGTTPYNYLWNDSSTSSVITDLPQGTYSVTVTDANGCTYSIPKIDVIEPLEVLDSIIFQEPSCYGKNDGFAQVLVGGGTPPYTYNWSNTQTTSTNIGLYSGAYTVTISDANGCTKVDALILTEPLEIVYTSEITSASCIDNFDGEIAITVYGGTRPYSYMWSNNETGSAITGLYAGEYSITVTDNNNCEINETFTVDETQISCLDIPTLFTPNNDGINDYWEIKGIAVYPDAEVEVFNRWGDVVFKSKGYTEPWDGTYNGRQLPISSYVFILSLNNGSEPIQGIVTIKY